MNKKARPFSSVFIGGFFLLVDQLLKYVARTNPTFSWYVWKPFLGWEFLANRGVAFSLSIPNSIVLLITPIIIGCLVYYLLLHEQKHAHTPLRILAVTLIIAGAVSNFVDRIIFQATIDYLRILTSVFNIADVMILVGAGILFLEERKKKRSGVVIDDK